MSPRDDAKQQLGAFLSSALSETQVREASSLVAKYVAACVQEERAKQLAEARRTIDQVRREGAAREAALKAQLDRARLNPFGSILGGV